MSIRCLIFKVPSLAAVSVRAFLFYHIRFALSIGFLKFLKKFYRPLTAPRLRQPYYLITSSSLCQVLFLIFSNLFFAPASLRSPFPRQLFSLYRAAFCASPAPSLCDSDAILALSRGNVKHFFPEFLCLLILLLFSAHLLTFVTKVVRMFSTAITDCIALCLDLLQSVY